MNTHSSGGAGIPLTIVILLACLVIGTAAGLVTWSMAGVKGEPSGKSETGTAQPTEAVSDKPPVNPQLSFDVNNAMAHISELAGTIGGREEGTAGEQATVDYVTRRLKDYGYSPTVQAFPVSTTGRTSHNVVASLEGSARPETVLVLGAHMDSKNGPGANDNATGCGILLELARILKGNNKQVPTVEFVFFGGEEIAAGGSSDDHHWGSRYFVNSLPDGDKRAIAGMISVDMVGAGPDFRVRNIGVAAPTMQNLLLDCGASRGLAYLADSASGQSDHEPFERAGIPSAWLEYRDIDVYHTPGDTVASVDASHVLNTGQLLQDFFENYLNTDKVKVLVNRS